MKMTIDCYNHHHTDERFLSKEETPYMVDSSTSGVVYMRFGQGDTCPIVRIVTANNVVTQAWAYGSWANRSSLSYDKMLSEGLVIQE